MDEAIRSNLETAHQGYPSALLRLLRSTEECEPGVQEPDVSPSSKVTTSSPLSLACGTKPESSHSYRRFPATPVELANITDDNLKFSFLSAGVTLLSTTPLVGIVCDSIFQRGNVIHTGCCSSKRHTFAKSWRN